MELLLLHFTPSVPQQLPLNRNLLRYLVLGRSGLFNLTPLLRAFDRGQDWKLCPALHRRALENCGRGSHLWQQATEKSHKLQLL